MKSSTQSHFFSKKQEVKKDALLPWQVVHGDRGQPAAAGRGAAHAPRPRRHALRQHHARQEDLPEQGAKTSPDPELADLTFCSCISRFFSVITIPEALLMARRDSQSEFSKVEFSIVFYLFFSLFRLL